MDAPVSRNFLKIQFLKLISVMTHFVLEKIDWDIQFSEWIRRFWAFFEKFHLWKFLQVFWLILYVKKLILRFAIFWMNQKILRNFWKIPFLKKNSKCFESFWEIFWKKLNFEKFTSVLTHFVWGKNVWMIKIDVWKSFFPRLKIIFPTSENHFSPY